MNKFILNVKSNLNPAKDQYLYRKKALESKRKDTLEFVGGFSGGSDGKEPACNAGDQGSIPGLGRSPEEGNGYPLQYSCLENPVDKDYSPWGCKELGMTERLTRPNKRGV